MEGAAPVSDFFWRTWRVAVVEWLTALRNRRALVTSLLFVVVSGLVMYGTVSLFAALEREVVSLLKLPAADGTGSVTMTLWKSTAFSHVVEHLCDSSLVFADVRGRHPILLAYALFIFQIAPILTLVVSSSRICDDVRSGTARYWLVRVTRTEWSLGKFVGEALMLAVAMLAGALAAWGVAALRLAGADGLRLLPGILDWTARAWVYAFAWLGLFTGLSHLAKSGGKAMALSILAMMGASAWPVMLENFAADEGVLSGLTHLDAFVPSSAAWSLWRRSPGQLFLGVTHLAALAFLYLSVGAAYFRRRDA